jgi:hypothetical protein
MPKPHCALQRAFLNLRATRWQYPHTVSRAESRAEAALDELCIKLRALRPRRNEAGKVQRLLDHVRASKRTLVQLRSATAAHDAAAATKVWRRLAVENRVTTKEARALGWTVCASDPRW